jgi:putative salt-induced outer membrane protein YdiY
MKFVYAIALLFSFAAISTTTLADAIQLKNGDHLTGSITDSDGKTLTIHTDYAGDVKVQWSAITQVTAAKPTFVVTSDKQTVNGTIEPQGSNLVVHTSEARAVVVPLAQITAVRSTEAQESYEKSLHPSLVQAWNVAATMGFALARGNSDTTNLNTGVTANRKTLGDQIAVYESSIYTDNGGPGGGVTANEILGGARYDRNIEPKLFFFAAGDFTHDELQHLDLQSIYSGGLGWHAINNPKTTLDVLLGLNYTRATYSSGAVLGMTTTTSVNRNLPGITAGEDFIHKFNGATSFTEHFYFYPDLDALSQYRISLDSAFVAKFNKWLGWQVSVSDRYVTNPPIIGTKSNDFVLSTGLNIAIVGK